MAKQNKAQEVQARIKEMQDKKAAELEVVHQKQTEAQTQKEAAELAIKDATERMDLDAYEEAKAAKRKAQTAIDMYGGKYTQIKQQEYISEQDSDKVIADLLDYEKQLAADFKAGLVEPLKQLAKMQEEYRAAVAETEATIVSWTRNIHANYQTPSTTYADGSHRSPHPVAVHTIPYTGCSEAAQLEDYLKKAEKVYKG